MFALLALGGGVSGSPAATEGGAADVFVEDFSGGVKAWAAAEGLDPEVGFAAPPSLRLTRTNHYSMTARPIPIDRDSTYEFGAWVRTAGDVTSSSKLYVRLFDSEGKVIATRGSAGTTATDWSYQSVLIQPEDWPAEAAAAGIMLQNAVGKDHTGTAWFDDVRVVRHGAESEGAGVVPIVFHEASSTAGEAFGVLNATDASPITQWRSEPGDEAWVWVAFEGAKRVNGVSLRQPAAPASHQARILTWDEQARDWQPAGDWQPLTPDAETRVSFPEVQTRRLRVELRPETGGAAAVSDLRVFGPLPSEQEYWQAEWIWYPEDANANPFVDRYFVKRFQLPDAVEEAWLQYAADDRATVWVNGHRVPSSPAEWREVQAHPVAQWLRPGGNVLAVKVHQARYSAGLVLECTMRAADGEWETVATDASWVASKEAGAEWPEVGPESGGAWEPVILFGRPPVKPWGSIGYEYVGQRAAAELVSLEVPESVAAGETVRLAATLRAQEAIGRRVEATLSLSRGGVTYYEQTLSPDRPSLEIAAGESFTLGPVEIPLSRYTPDGVYDLVLNIPFVSLGSARGDGVVARVEVRNDRKAELPRVEFREMSGTPTLFINGEPTYGTGYRHRPTIDRAYQRLMYGDFADADIPVGHVSAGGQSSGEVWVGPGQYNMAPVDQQVLDFLRAHPDGWIRLSVHMPSLVPSWWVSSHPDELYVLDDGSRMSHPSLASPVYARESEELLGAIVDHVRTSPYADRIIEFIVGEGAEGQYLHWWRKNPESPGSQTDYSGPARAGFRDWLRERYATEEALREAWADPTAGFDTAEPPGNEARTTMHQGMFVDPAKGRQVPDFLLYLSDIMADTAARHARVVRERTDGRSLFGLYYGHVLDVGNYFLIQDGGYLTIESVIDNPDVHVLYGPISYAGAFRDVGGSASTDFPPPGSLRLRNKVFFNEEDLRTHLVWPGDYAYSTSTLADTIAVLRREFANAYCNEAGLFWVNLTRTVGWFDHPEVMAELGRLEALAAERLGHDRRAAAEVAVIIEPRSHAYMKPITVGERRRTFSIANELLTGQRDAIQRIGAPVAYHLASDLRRGDMPDYKLYVFLNAMYLDDETRAAAHRKLEKNGATALWFYAPGYVTDRALSLDAAAELSGFRLAHTRLDEPVTMTLDAALGGGTSEAPRPVDLLFHADEPEAQVLGRFPGDRVGLASRTMPGGWRSIYSSLPILSPDVLRRFAEEAGVHVWTDSGDALYATGSMVAMHTREAGPKSIRLPVEAAVTDAITGEPVTLDTEGRFDFASPGRETRIFLIDPVHSKGGSR